MPFGITPAPEIFQMKLDQNLEGHRLTKEGLKPDPAKLRAIMNMKKPDDVAAIQRLMGMVK